MSNENMSMSELMNDFEMKSFRKGDIIKGKVVSAKNDEIIVNIGHFADGVVARGELSNDPSFSISSIQPDDEIYVMVLSTDDGYGNVELSKRRADAIKVWDSLEEIYQNGKIMNVKMSEVTKGGLISNIEGVRVFMPASQTSAKRLENIEVLIGKDLEVKIIEFNRKDRKVVISRRVIEEEELKKEEMKIWNTLVAGEKKVGTVTKLMKFGAFVNIDGVEGLIHINDLAWTRVRKVEDILSVGDTVEVYIKDIDLDKRRMGLSLKDLCENPWSKFAKNNNVGDTVDAKIVKFIQAGAIAAVDEGVEGLVHISEITDEHITSADSVLSLGQVVKVKILSIDEENERLSLSIKDSVDRTEEFKQYVDEEEGFGLADLFKDLKL
ncbi:MAG: 30S ribosomal protein S1 [Sarcina sp.]